MTKAEEAALKAYPSQKPHSLFGFSLEYSHILHRREAFAEGYKQAEKDMREKFIQFIYQHYPLNYVGWITDFQRYMDKEQ